MAELSKSDLDFILQQILIAEAHAAGQDLTTLLPNMLVPFGLRTVDGSYNNLLHPEFGAADNVFPRLTDPIFRDAETTPPGFGPPVPTSYEQVSGNVFDSQPRVISNLIVDQTAHNPAAVAAALGTPGSEMVTSPGLDGVFGTPDDRDVFFIPNVTPDAGLSAPFNAWMTFFGQFFDHGLDLVTKGGSGTVFIPLKADDPLIPGADGILGTPDDLPASQQFMVVSRATNQPGPDGMLGTSDDIHEHQNTTSPFVDQNQTYSSHPSHQVFLRAYELVGGKPVATGKLIVNRDLGADGHFGGAGLNADTEIGGMATWAVVKAQARDLLGITLTDADFNNVPLLATDQYGNFIPGTHGFAQVVVRTGNGADGIAGTSDDITILKEGVAGGLDIHDAALLGGTLVGTGHAFLNDIAHSAVPLDDFGNALAPDADNVIGGTPAAGSYDNELLDAHYIAGDGRVNENIGLTTVHQMFHSEHNRQVDAVKATLLATHDLAALSPWLLDAPAAFPTTQAAIDALHWNGERLFQAAKFATEMQYQHLVFEEFARTVQPQVDAFLAPLGYDATIDPSIVAEFAHTVYRFGHSMLLETVDRLDPSFQSVDGDPQIGLIAAFLNPLAFRDSGPTPEEAAGAIIRGLTRQVGNEIDEFVTEALRNNLLGLPLDLPAINLARARDAGIPSLNAARAEFFHMTGDSQLTPYTSWADFVQHLKHPESLVNFIAAYGTHSSITSATTLDDKRAAAMALVFATAGSPADRLDFLNSTGDWANSGPHLKDLDGATTTGLGNVDLWIGGLAEEKMPFGGMLGSTFNFVFETQLEALQDGDRFYYLSRTAGMDFATELENNSFAKLVMANTDVTHLPSAIFSTPTWTLEVDPTHQFTGLGTDGHADPTGGTLLTPLVIRDNPATAGPDTNYLHYTGEDHVVLGGTAGNDIIVSGIGDDTLYGDAGNDRLDGGYGNDVLLGGDGHDILTDLGGDDNIQGGAGNDVIQAGNSTIAGVNLILAGPGSDFIITTEDTSEIFAGPGNDFILGAKVNGQEMGGEGDDWIEMGAQDGAPGDNFNPRLADNVQGNDIFLGGGGFDEFIGEGGDDIFVGSGAQDKMDGMSGFDWMTYKSDPFGVTADLTLAALGGVGEVADHIALPFAASPGSILDRFAEVEGLSGSKFTDILRGDNVDAVTILNHGGATGGALTNAGLINGLQALLGGATGFATGNIILGGDGSDIIEGRGGDDLIDGDRWLNVRISVHAGFDANGPTGAQIATFDSMADPTLLHNMLDGVWNPGQLQAVREIMPGSGPSFDTAVFSGNRADYTVVVNNGGTPTDFSDDVVIVTDSVVGRDGADRLLHMERLQFADQSVTLVPGLNTNPVGQLTIRDAATDAIDTTPTEGQLLRVSIAGVTDADNPAGGAITGSVSYLWQVERNPGTGVFEDIIVLPAGDLAFQSANGTTFRVTPDLAGLSLRVKAIYQDAHGVPEQVFSAPTDPVIDVPNAPVTPTTVVPPDFQAGGAGVHLIRSDLDFILDQIRIAEAHAHGADLLSLVPNIRAAAGLRTVDGSFNNLVNLNGINTTEFGAADNVFPRLTDPVFRNAENMSVDLDGPGPLTVGTPTSYQQTSGFVFDSQPRIISNLIVDQTANNPAAVAAAAQNPGAEIVKSPGLDGVFGTTDDRDVYLIPNVAPDAGLSAPFNAWMTFFGQFFDHGLDLVSKGGSGTVFMPLKADDPLVAGADGVFGNGDDLPPALRFMVLDRATNRPGPDGILGTADDIHEHENTTSPFVDQNQTYSSHPSHQVFLRAYELVAGAPIATGKLITNWNLGADGHFGGTGANADTVIGGMATWAVVKAQARDILGINLTDADFNNVPLLATDAYGNFIKSPAGRVQVVMKGADHLAGTADDVLVEGNPAAPISLADAVRTGHAFLNDIAHNAVPVFNASGQLVPDAGTAIGNAVPVDAQGNNLAYDNELLDAHYIAGDGRVNENIGLTTVHAIFHSEHNRLVDQTKETALASNDVAFLNEWLLNPVTSMPTTQAAIDALLWNGERLFQAAKFGTEMQYQHLVFEEFARTVQPMIDPFFAPTQVYEVEIDASIVAEFAHTVYRFGHSMLLETVDRFDANFDLVNGTDEQIGLIGAFLNPLAYAASGPTPEQATGAIVRGVTRQVGNEIDEFVTEALRNNLLGLPLDLASINLARGRDAGIPSLNAARREFYDATGDANLKPYTSWADLVQHLKHPESLINFIAAYGTHASITSKTTLIDKRAAAVALVLGGIGAPADRLDFLNSTGAYANVTLPGADSFLGTPDDIKGVTTTGVDAIDLWIGGLAEQQMPFGGLLGSTFNFVFENQLEKLQDGDRFYYLERTSGLNFNTELENNSFAKLIMANTDATHLPGLVFKAPAFTLEVDQSHQYTGLGPNHDADPTGGILLTPLVIRDNPATATHEDHNYLQYTGEDHVVLGGTPGDDIIRSSVGDDTLYGDAGNDRLDGGDGNDFLFGNAGNDILTDTGGDDNIQGGDGNDVIQGGNGINLILGGFGSDFIVTGEDASEAFGGVGNDFILGSKANEQDMGNEGDDWIEGGTSDGAPGDNFDPLGLDPIAGNDVYIGRGENDKFNAEGGDDIMVGSFGQGDRYIGASGYDWAVFKDDPYGVTIDFADRYFDQPPVPGSPASALARFDIVEGISGSSHGDVLRGDNEDATSLPTAGAQGSVLTNIGLIDGLGNFLDTMAGHHVDFFDGGNIILGGGGSDILEGRGGDDLIDGDAWLNVRISVRANGDGTGAQLDTFDSMVPLVPFMLAGTYQPGQLTIVREILHAAGPDFDTAVFSGSIGEYSLETNDNGTFDVSDDIITVIDSVVGRDGTDRLMHIEKLQFSDMALVLDPSMNSDPSGDMTIAGTAAEDSLLTVSIAGVTDPENVNLLTNPDGHIIGPVSYFWQVELVPDSGIFVGLDTFAAGEAERVHGATFTPGDDEVGLRLRVMAIYKDGSGVLETVFSAPTDAIANVNDPPIGTVVVSDTTPTETRQLLAFNNFTDADGLTTAVFAYQWQQANATGVGGGGAGFTNITGATDQAFTPAQAQVNRELRVVVTYTDDHGTTETVTSAATVVTGDFINDGNGGNTLNGNEGQDIINGNGGNDTINGNGQDDLLNGGTGNDTINAGAGNDTITGGAGTDTLNGQAGNDTFLYTIGDGADAVNGGADLDTLSISGTAAADTLDVIYNGTRLSQFEGGTINTTAANVTESVTADLLGGVDTLSYAGTAAANAVTVNLATGTASGFTAIAGIENVTGGDGNDTLTGDALANTLSGGAGNDTLTGGGGNDTLNGNGGANRFIFAASFGDDIINGFDANPGGGGQDLLNIAARGITASTFATSVTITDLGANTLVEFAGSTDSILLNGVDGVGNNVITQADFILAPGGAGGVSLIGDGAANVFTGTEFSDLLDGQGGNDTLSGLGGDDTLLGGAGTDLLDGGTGNDFMDGGTGNDTFVVDSAGDSVTEAAGGGTDLVQSSITYTLATDLENLTLTGAANLNGTGNAGANTITGNTGDNVLSGLAGADILNGGDGADTLLGGDQNDTLNGGAGNDLLDGGTGNDAMAGGTGDDTYVVNAAGDTLTEAAGAGTDLVQSGISFTLANNFENLTLTGAGNLNGTGNGAANTITGNTGNNTLSGAGGADTLIGNDGNDTLNGDAGADSLFGGDGTDTLSGGDGNDTLSGGAGNDTMNGNGGNDVFVFSNGFGNDTINGFDANPGGGGQDLLDIGAFGITAATFAANVVITDLGANTLVDIIGADHTITLNGVNGVGTNVITVTDFILAP